MNPSPPLGGSTSWRIKRSIIICQAIKMFVRIVSSYAGSLVRFADRIYLAGNKNLLSGVEIVRR